MLDSKSIQPNLTVCIAAIAALSFLLTPLYGASGEPAYGAYSPSSDDRPNEFTVRLANRSGGEVHYGILRILDSETQAVQAEFHHVSMSVGGSVSLSFSRSPSQESDERPLPAELEWFDDNGVRHQAAFELQFLSEPAFGQM
jgi:hypothetical protein